MYQQAEIKDILTSNHIKVSWKSRDKLQTNHQSTTKFNLYQDRWSNFIICTISSSISHFL